MDRDVGGEALRGRCGGSINPVAFECGGWGELFGEIEEPDPGGKRFLVVERWIGRGGGRLPVLRADFCYLQGGGVGVEFGFGVDQEAQLVLPEIVLVAGEHGSET